MPAHRVRAPAPRPRHGRGHDPAGGRHQRARRDFKKGCYVGQETVARLHYRGKPNRHLRGLRLAEPAERRDEILLGDKVVGGSARPASPRGFGPIALALVRREAAPGDTVLRRRRRGRRSPSCRSSVAERRRRLAAQPVRTAARPVAREPAARLRPARRRARPAAASPSAGPPSSRSTRATCASWCRPPSRAAQLDDWGRSQRVFERSSRCSTSTTATGSAWRSRASRTCPPRAAR